MNSFQLERILARYGLKIVKVENMPSNIGLSPNETFVRALNKDTHPHPDLEQKTLDAKKGCTK